MRHRLKMIGSVLATGLACGTLLPACSPARTQTQEKLSTPTPSPTVEKSEPTTAGQGKTYVIAGKTYFAPVSVRQADMHMDGGTLSLLIVDALGQRLWACNDGRGTRDQTKEEVGRRPIYVGGHHPIVRTAKPLELGGADEQSLYQMLKEWFDEARRQGGPKFSGVGADLQTEHAEDFLDYLKRHVERHKPK